MIPLTTADAPDPRLLGGAIAIGNFDGVHRGHAQLIDRLRRMAQRLGGPAVAVTFDPPPVAILRPQSKPLALTTIPRREALLRRCGADGVVVIRTDRSLLGQSPETFFKHLVRGTLQARGMVEGPNFFFGRDRAGNPHLLRRLCQREGIECEIVEPAEIEGRMISSTRVRQLLNEGDVAQAAAVLVAPYRLQGMVRSGAGRGRQLGFPTANLERIPTVIPAHGVYACRVLAAGRSYAAAVHIGPTPTFSDLQSKVEVHLLDFGGDLYGCQLEVDFVARVRRVRDFGSAGALQLQLAADLKSVRAALAMVQE